MTESDDLDLRVRDALARSAGNVPVGPPPLADLHEAARVRRRRGRLRVAAASLATAVVVGGGVVAVAVLPDRATDAVDIDDGVAEGKRLVGVGRLGVLVPEEWGDAELGCGTPVSTGIVRTKGGATCAALMLRPADVVSVTVSDDPWLLEPIAQAPGDDGIQRSETTCDESGGRGGVPVVTLCRATVTDGTTASVVVESSEDDRDVARATVDEIVASIELLPDGQVAVPEPGLFDSPETYAPSPDVYADALNELGLALERTERLVPGRRGGTLIEVSPLPGTLVEPGTTVTAVVTAAQPAGPAAIYQVSGSVYAGEEFRGTLTDTELRAQDTVVSLEEDALLSLSAQSEFRGPMGSSGIGLEDLLVLTSSDPTVAATDVRSVFGDVVAVAPGTADITVDIVIDGAVVPIGSFTVDVS